MGKSICCRTVKYFSLRLTHVLLFFRNMSISRPCVAIGPDTPCAVSGCIVELNSRQEDSVFNVFLGPKTSIELLFNCVHTIIKHTPYQ